ncbi:LOW QUALITY PROTEIN: neuron navigator 1 [Synchiropus picturatus]
MSGGTNVKSALRPPAAPGAPLRCSLLPCSPKADLRHRSVDRTLSQAPTRTPSPQSSSSRILTIKDQRRELKTQVRQRSGGLPVLQSSRSAYSSPITPRRVPSPHSKDTLDLARPSTSLTPDGNHNTRAFTNKNQAWRASNLRPPTQMRRGHNVQHPQKEPEPQLAQVDNSNLFVPHANTAAVDRCHSGSNSQSDEEMGTPECSPPCSPHTHSVANHMTSREPHTPRVNMATVAPFSFKLQLQDGDFPGDELSDCSSGSIDVCCHDITGGMLEANVTAKPRELDVSSQDPSVQIMSGRKTSALPQAPPRSSGSELKVYKPTSGSIPLANPSKLRKQRSLTNLCVLTDAEKKLHLYQTPKWADDAGRPAAASSQAGPAKTAQAGGGKAQLSRTLSKSEQSLFQGKPKPLASTAPNISRPSRIPAPGKPRGLCAEVKPISKGAEEGEDLSDHPKKACAAGAANSGTNVKKASEQAAAPTPDEKKGVEGEQDKSFLKVDPELVVTVLGDLEQLLFSQMLDPESQRKRTVQNVLDLRQNLEETMSSLRGVQLSHSAVEGPVCYDSDEVAAFSMSSFSSRSSPLSWRHGQASPRLQAGDAPSTGSTHADIPLRISHTARIHLIEALEDSDPAPLKGNYLSDRSPVEEDDDDDVDIDDLENGWDESSSISSGLSDGSDNLSSEEFNTSPTLNSLPTSPVGSRRNSAVVMRTDAEKRSLVESGLSWDSEERKPSRKSLGGGVYDPGNLKSESATKWKKSRPAGGGGEVTKGELKRPQTLSHALKKGRNPPVGVTSPITHSAQSGLKLPCASKAEGKPTDKSRLALKNSSLQRSSSDAGKDHGNGSSEQRKPPSGLVRPSTGGSFGFKKPSSAGCNGTQNPNMPGGVSGIPSPAASKTPKTSGIPVKPGAGGSASVRKTSLDVSSSDPSGFLSPNARTSLQYRSLPRPAKTSALTLTRPSSARPVSTTVDTAPQGLKLKDHCPGKASGRRIPSPGPVNQTDREKEKERAKAKAVVSDSECGGGLLKGSSAQAPSENGVKLQGLRPPSCSKSSELPSPGSHRVRSLSKPPSVAQLDKLNSKSLDEDYQDPLPPKIAPYSEPSSLTPGPAPHLTAPSRFSGSGIGLGPRQVTSLGVEESGGSTSPLLYPRMSSLHRSMESLPFQMSLAPEPHGRDQDRGAVATEPRERSRQAVSWSCGSKLSRIADRDRNTLPKKGLSFNSASQLEEEEGGDVSDCLGLPSLSSPASLPRTSKTSLVSSPGGPPRMTRSNSIPTHDGALDLGSTLSLAERPRSMGMVRSGSFRDKDPCDEVHGSVISLASNASSSYSSAEERLQGEQIRKLRRELESSQEKVSTLTTQLTANANLVAAFEQSLTLMTTRLQSLSISHEQKDTELMELRETIDALKAKNEEAQAVIHGALHNPDHMKDVSMRRQNSCESISSLNSLTSMSSVGSLKDQDAKKKKKKSWLRSSFNKAFSIKKGSKTYSDIEEIATPESSAPNSPKMPHDATETLEASKCGDSTCCEFAASAQDMVSEDGGERAVSELRSELWEKERALTDIRLEALNSAHQLEQLRDAMNNMQVSLDAAVHRGALLHLTSVLLCAQSTVECLKAENDHLKIGSRLQQPGPGPSSSASQPSGLGAPPLQPASTSLTKSFSLSLAESSVPCPRDEVCARVLVRSTDPLQDGKRPQDHYLGSVLVSSRTDWTTLDSLVAKTFRDYLSQVDPTASLGLSSDSLLMYQLSQGAARVVGGEMPAGCPHRCLGSGTPRVVVSLKGLQQDSVDSLVFETLIPKPMMQHYISLLLKHRRLVLSGPSGTGKTYLAQHLARYLLQRAGGRGATVSFNMHRQSEKELQLYLSDLASQMEREGAADTPLVVIIDDVGDSAAITELVNAALTCNYHKCPYVIGTTNQPVKMSSNHGLHLSFRMVTFSNNVEPANGFLLRYLHRKVLESQQQPEEEERLALLPVLDWIPQLWYHLHTFLEKHSTSDFLIGPCFFLSCPVTVAEIRQWFIDLWNHSIIPYLQEGAKDGIKVRGQKAVWEDPVEWVRGTLPWPDAQQDQARLFHLPPPSVAAHSEERRKPVRDTPPPSALDSDPLMAMLLKLQESANCMESPEREGSLDPGALQATF